MYRAIPSCPATDRANRLVDPPENAPTEFPPWNSLSATVLCLAAAAFPACSGTTVAVCASDIDCGAATACDHGQCRSEANATHADLRPHRMPLSPVDDAAVVSTSCCRGTAYGTHDILAIGRGAEGETYRTYISFDTSDIEAREIVHAELRLVSNGNHSRGAETMEVLVYPVTSAWSRAGLTWRSQPGGRGSPMAQAHIRPGQNGVTSIDVTRLVSAWVAGASPNRGLLLRARQEVRDSRAVWYSMETADAERRPLLEVEVR